MGYMYIVVRTDSDNVSHAYERVYNKEYDACCELSSAASMFAWISDLHGHIDRESDTVLTVWGKSGRRLARFEVFQLVRDR